MSATEVRDLPPGGKVTVSMNMSWANSSEPTRVEVKVVEAPIEVIDFSQDIDPGIHMRARMPIGGGSVVFRPTSSRVSGDSDGVATVVFSGEFVSKSP